MNTLSFPGLGIGEFTVNPVAFTIFGKDIMWYGILVTSGIVLGFLYAVYRSKFEGIPYDTLIDLAMWVVVFAIIGTRLYYVLMNLENYKTFYDVIAIWNGGLAIYGGIIGGGLAALIFCKLRKLSFLQAADMIMPGVLIGQIIGRWGNFMNAEAYGYETSLPWRMGIRRGDYTLYVHPTFFYESFWNLIGFLIINASYKKKKYNGQIFLEYFTWYGFGRMIIEGLRTDSLYLGGTSIRVSQLVALLSFVIGAILLIVLGIRAKKKEKLSV